MFRSVKVPPGTVIAVYRFTRKGEFRFFGATHVTGQARRVPVLWGYKHALFSDAPQPLEIEREAAFSDGRAVIKLSVTVAVTAWSAEGAVQNVLGKSFDDVLASAREAIERTVDGAAALFTAARARSASDELVFEIARKGNLALERVGLTLMTVNIISISA